MMSDGGMGERRGSLSFRLDDRVHCFGVQSLLGAMHVMSILSLETHLIISCLPSYDNKPVLQSFLITC